MLEKLVIRNFQVHRDLEVVFDPAVTTIVGASDRGKSAVIRALRWICQNRPQGDEFIQHGRKSTSARLFVDGHEILRRRGKSNLYELDGKEFVSFGAGVPDPIAALLNIGDENFQGQHDPAFWLSDPPGLVSKKLNAVINLGTIDSALKNIGLAVKRADSAVEFTRSRLKTARAEAEKLDWVADFDADLAKLEKDYSKIRGKRTRIEQAASALETLESATSAAKSLREPLQEGRDLLELARQARQSEKRVARFEQLMGLISVGDEQCARLETEIEGLKKKLLTAEREVKKCPTCGRPI